MDLFDWKKIGAELKRLRKENGYTQEKIAEDLECTVAFISNVENNRVKLNLRTLTYYARLCNVSVDSILAVGLPESERNTSKNRDDELVRLFHQFSVEQQEKIIDIFKIML